MQMLKITLLTVGRLKESYLREAAAEYGKRLSAFCALKTEELEPARLPDRPSEAQIAAALEDEGGRILAKIPAGAGVFALCVEGKPLTSQDLAARLADAPLRGVSRLCFVIGGSHGLSPAVKKRAGLRLSMSAMTFPHQLARVMLLEQIYRGFQINLGSAYHK